MTTVAQLIEQLKDENPNLPIVFQYLTPEHLSMDTETFEQVSERLEKSNFYSDLTEQMVMAIRDTEADLEAED